MTRPVGVVSGDVISDLGNKRLRRCLAAFLSSTLVVGVLVPFVDLPELSRERIERLPPHLAKVIVKRTPPPRPEPDKPVLAKVLQPKHPKKPEKPKLDVTPQKVKPVHEEKPLPPRKPQRPVTTQAEKEAVKKARQKAASTGVFAAQDVLADMRKTLASTTSQAVSRRITTAGGTAKAPEQDAAVLAASSRRTSGGLHGPVSMRMTQGASTLTKNDERVLIGDGDAGEADAGVALAETGRTGRQRIRSEASIRQIFDQHKGAVDALYRRALRHNPSLQGRVTVEVVIEPTGTISQCRIVSSDLGDDKLEARLMSRIRLINFGANQVGQQTVQYAFEFVPS